MKRSTLLTGLVAVMMVASIASAVTIDTFTTGAKTQTVSLNDSPDVYPTSDTYTPSGLSGVIGGAREAYVVSQQGPGNVVFSVGEAVSGAAQYSAQSLNAGSFSLAYGSLISGGSDLGANFTGDNYLRIKFYSNGEPEQTFNLTMTIDSGGTIANKTYSIAAGTSEALLAYSEVDPFTASDIDGIKLYFDNGSNFGQDFTFSLVDSVVPEPASMSLLALGGIAMLKRRKRA